MGYDIRKHKHRFSCWAASRASSVKGCRFSVLQGKMIIEGSGLQNVVDELSLFPSNYTEFDKFHAEWRERVISKAREIGLIFTHGVAAKLINVYLKSTLVCGGYEDVDQVALVHPPVDQLLLKALREKGPEDMRPTWKRALKKRWSKFDSDDYQNVISGIRKMMGGRPMWEVEEYWQGYQ